jgi:hypothetical protein
MGYFDESMRCLETALRLDEKLAEEAWHTKAPFFSVI